MLKYVALIVTLWVLGFFLRRWTRYEAERRMARILADELFTRRRHKR